MTTWKTGQMDPPWMEQGAGKIKRGADRHYPLLKTKDMPLVIRDSGLWTPDENAHLFLWVTNNFLRDGLWLMEELEFEYKTNICWTKTRPGIGRYFRGKHELLLFGTRGRGWAVRTERNDIASEIETDEDWEAYFDGSVVRAQHETLHGKRVHSAKPRVFYDMIESRSQGPYVEFFARSLRPGWQTFGNDVALTAPSSIVAATQAVLARQREEAGLPPEPPPKKTRAKKKPADVMPIAEMDGVDIMLNASREPVEATCPQCLARVLCVERETSCTCGNKLTLMPPRYRAYAFANGKVQGEVPNVMFEVKVSDAPLPPPPAVSFIEQLEAAFAIPADPDCSLDLLERTPPTNAPPTKTVHRFAPRPDSRYCAQCPCEEYDPIHSSSAPELQLDGLFMTGPLPGGPTRHLPKPDLIPPPRPEKCQHGDVRSACILCRARR